MTSLTYPLLILFGLVGAHVPRSFTLMYLILGLSALMALPSESRHNIPLPLSGQRLFRILQLLVFLFSLSYPLAMVHYGFWDLDKRYLPDILNALLLPNALFLWGFHMACKRFRLLNACLLAYSFGGLVFLLSALIHTRGFDWFAFGFSHGSLSLPWGNHSSMNVRSVEQNGILNIVMMPVGIYALSVRRYWLSVFFLSLSFIALLAVLPLANGRLWIISILLSFWPLACRSFNSVSSRLTLTQYSWTGPACLISLIATIILSVHPRFNDFFCDERFEMYRQAVIHWKELISGGRLLAFRSLLCDGRSSVLVSLNGMPNSDVTMLHSVPLDVAASVGLLVAFPLLVVLATALVLFFVFALCWARNQATLPTTFDSYVFWSFLATLIPQLFFQPLIYGDGLLYYLSYAVIAALLFMISANPHSFPNSLRLLLPH